MASMGVQRTNFEDGDWQANCPHCGEKQMDHCVVRGPDVEGNYYEHRKPCEEELGKMHRKYRSLNLMGKVIIFCAIVAIPLCMMIVFQLSSFLGWLAFAYGVFKLSVVALKHYGNPHKWIPGHTDKMERENLHAHYIYHCERNPEAFERLKLENFKKWCDED